MCSRIPWCCVVIDCAMSSCIGSVAKLMSEPLGAFTKPCKEREGGVGAREGGSDASHPVCKDKGEEGRASSHFRLVVVGSMITVEKPHGDPMKGR